MKTIDRTVSALSAATCVPTLFAVVPYAVSEFSNPSIPVDAYTFVRIFGFSMLALIVAMIHVGILGFPTFLLLSKFNKVNWVSSTIAGFLLGVLPISTITWPLRYLSPGTSYTYKNGSGPEVHAIVNGVLTSAGWADWLGDMAWWGMLGAVGGLSFWLVWHKRGPRTPEGDCQSS